MRQIQDLTFAVARGLDAVDQRFAQLRESFRVWSSIDHAPANAKRMGIRVSCVPSSGECFLDRVHGIDVVKPRQRRATVEIKGQSFDLVVPFDVYNWRPLLRGTGAEETHNERKARIYLYCDGALTYEYVADVLATVDAGSMDSRVYRLYPGWLFGIIVNAIEAADRFRVEAGASAVDYAVEIEIASSHGLVVYRMGARSDFDKAGELPAGTHVYPRYVLSAKDSWSETLTLMWRDFWNSIGVPEGDDYLRLDHPS